MSYNGSGTFVINSTGQPVVSGTVISSTAFNALTADLATGLSTCITKDGQTTVTANIPMSNYKFTGLGAGSAATDSANLSQVQSSVVKLLASVSGADTITAVGSPTVTAYAAGQMFYFIAAGDNTTTVTLNIDGLGAKAVTRDGSVALAAGDIKSGEVVVVVYDGTRFQVVSQINSSGNATFANVSITSALNVGGVATFTSNPVLSGGTANGVLYLNGSKVATSGSALTFDGTNLNTGSATFPSGRVRLKQADDTTKQKGLIIEAAADDSILAVGYDGTCFTYNATYNTGGAYKPQAWWVSGSEQMRLTSTGLGIGTSSPGGKLQVSGGRSVFKPTAEQYAIALGRSDFTNTAYIGVANSSSNPDLVFSNNAGTTLATLTDSGNLGLGVTPSAWDSSYKAITVNNVSVASQDQTGGAEFTKNSFVASGGSNKYIANGFATKYEQASGTHKWYYAASGTAGNAITFTQAMTLDASSNLMVGDTTASGRLTVKRSTDGTIGYFDGSTTQFRIDVASSTINLNAQNGNGVMAFQTNGTERARITSAGYFKASNTGTYNNSTGAYHEFYQSSNTLACLFRATSATFSQTLIEGVVDRTTTNGSYRLIDVYNGNITGRFLVLDSGNAQNTNSSYGGTSDIKLKQDIVDAASQWDDIKSLRVRKYRFKDNPESALQIGVVAQEIETVSPGLVEEIIDRDKDGNDLGTTTKSVKYSILYMKAVKALQEAMARIEQLETKVAALESK